MFSTQSKTEILILATMNLSSAIAFNLDSAKILLLSKELNSRALSAYWQKNVRLVQIQLFKKRKNFGQVKTESICKINDKINMIENLKFVFGRVENIVGKGEDTG